MVSSFQLQHSFLCSIQKRWVHLNFVSEINWNPKQPTQVYEIRVGYIILCRCVVPKREKKLLLCNFFGASNFLTVLHRKSYPKRSLLLLHKVGGWQPVLAFGISKRYCTYEVFNISKGLGGFQLLDLIITELKSHMTCYYSMPLIS